MFIYRVVKRKAREKSYKCWIQLGKITEDPVGIPVSLCELFGELVRFDYGKGHRG